MDGRIGLFAVRYDEDNNVTWPVRLTIRLASGKSLAGAICHLTDDRRIYTETPPEVNDDGSITVTLHPCSFVYIEIPGLSAPY